MFEITDPRERIKIEIKSDAVDVCTELPRKEALAFVQDILEKNPNDAWLQENLEASMTCFGFRGCSWGIDHNITISGYLPTVVLTEAVTCPRRMLDWGPWAHEENLDHWNLVGDDKVCSFCGSLHPDRVIELIKQLGTKIVERSDKGYKFYVNRDTVPNASYGGITYYRYHDTPAFFEELTMLLQQ